LEPAIIKPDGRQGKVSSAFRDAGPRDGQGVLAGGRESRCGVLPDCCLNPGAASLAFALFRRMMTPKRLEPERMPSPKAAVADDRSGSPFAMPVRGSDSRLLI